MDIKRAAIWLAVITVACLATGAVLLRETVYNLTTRGFGAEYSDSKSVALASTGEIHIVCPSPSVTIVPTSDSQVTAKISGRFSVEPELSVSSDSGRITVEVRRKPGHTSWTMVDGLLEVLIPAQFAGDLKVNSSSGGVRVRNFGFDTMDIRCISGNVECESITAAKTIIDVSSGRIGLTAHSGSVNLTSSSGNIDASIKSPGDTVQISASSGNVHVRLPRSGSMDLNARASSGRVVCELPITLRRSGQNFLEGVVGQSPAHTRADISTRSGNVTIRGE